MKKAIFLAGISGLLMAAPAHAQFGGMAPKLPGASKGNDSASSVSADDVDEFLAKTLTATKYVWLSMEILNKAAEGHGALGASKQTLTSISGYQSTKEANANIQSLNSTASALQGNKQLADQVSANYQAASAAEKAMIAAAIYNFAVFLPQLAKMPQNVSELVKGIGSNPRLLSKAGELKTAGSLIGVQLKGTATVLTVLPKLMTVAKVKAPANPETSAPKPFDMNSLPG